MEPLLSQQDVQFPIRLPGIEKNGDRRSFLGCGRQCAVGVVRLGGLPGMYGQF